MLDHVWPGVNQYVQEYFLGQIWSRNLKLSQFKLKFGTKTNSDIRNSMVVSPFFISDWKYRFLADLVQKNQNYQLRLKFGNLA